MEFYLHFNLDMDRSPGFGPYATNYLALFRLALAAAPDLKSLTLLATYARRTILQKVPYHALTRSMCLWHRVSGSISLPSRGAFHRSFTVLFAIGHWVVFRLGGWSPRLPTGFLVPRGTLDTARLPLFSHTRLSRPPVCRPMHFC